MDQETLYLTARLEKELLERYNKFRPGMGIIFAGKGKNNQWYADATPGNSIALISNETETDSKIIEYLYQNKKRVRLIPWIQYSEEEYTEGLYNFIKNHLSDVFNNLILLRSPKTADNSFGYLTIDFKFVRKVGEITPDSVKEGEVIVIPNHELDPRAAKNLDTLISAVEKITLTSLVK